MSVERICYALVYLAEAMMAWQYFGRLFMLKYKERPVIASILAAHFLLFLISFKNNLAMNASGFYLVNFLLLLTFYVCPVKTALLHSAFMSFIMIGSELIVSMLINLAVKDYGAYSYSLTILVTLGVCSKLLYFFVIMISTKYSSPYKSKSNDPNYMILLCSLPVASMLVAATTVFIVLNCNPVLWLEIMIAASILALLAVNILVLMVYDRIRQLHADNVSLQLSAARTSANIEYYSMLSEQYDKQRIMIHDFNRHLSTLNALVSVGDKDNAQKYLKSLAEMPELKTRMRICNEPILNVMLVQFSEQCRDNKINFICNIKNESFSSFELIDLSSLFANLLSNSFDAAVKSVEKHIELSVTLTVNEDNLIITLENSCDNPPVIDSMGKFISQKNETDSHGIGLKSIERTVKKYNGLLKMYYNSGEKRFHTIISMLI